MANNYFVHSAVRILIADQVTESSLIAIYKPLKYRMELMGIATHLLFRANTPLPMGLKCCEFDIQAFQTHAHQHPQDLQSRKYAYGKTKIFRNMLPDPGQSQGHRYNQSHCYIAIALAVVESIGDRKGMDEANRETGGSTSSERGYA